MGKRDIVIIGSGGLAKEVRGVIGNCNRNQDRWNILGWVSKEAPGTLIDELPVLGDDDWLLGYDSPIDVAVSVGDGNLRKKIVLTLKENKNISFPTIISPSAELAYSVRIGEGSIIMAKSVLTVDIEIGDFFVCNPACTVSHECKFKDYVTLNPGSNIAGNVSLGECVSIGIGASIIQGLSVGDHTMIGAGAVVINDIPSDSTAVGVPARVLEK